MQPVAVRAPVRATRPFEREVKRLSALFLAAVACQGCGSGPQAPEGELPGPQVRALHDSFLEMGVWAAPGAFGSPSPIMRFDCPNGGGVNIAGEGSLDGETVDYSFVLTATECGLAGGGAAFVVDGELSGSGGHSRSEDALVGGYRVEGELIWEAEGRSGACVAALDVATRYYLTEEQAEAGSVDGTLCGLPVGRYP